MSYEAETHEAEAEHFLFEHEGEHEHEHELGHEHELAHEGELTEAEANELASRFLELESEAELDRFLPFLLPVAKLAISGLGKLAAKGVGKLAAKGVGKMLKGVGKKGLQQLRRPRRNRPTRQSTSACSCAHEQEHEHFLGSIVGSLFGGGGELEGEAEHQFEAAKRFVRFGNAALCRTLAASRRLPPPAAARTGVISAARTFAPKLVTRAPRCGTCGGPIRRATVATGARRRPAGMTRAAGAAGMPRRPGSPGPVRRPQTMATPIAAPATNGALRGSQGRWVRRGGSIILTGC